MNRLALDASAVIKLYIDESDSHLYERAIQTTEHFIGPDLMRAESANVLWKKVRRGDLTADQAEQVLSDIMRMAIEIVPLGHVTQRAMTLAIETDRSVYDCIYLATAELADANLLTADRKLANALTSHRLASFIHCPGQ